MSSKKKKVTRRAKKSPTKSERELGRAFAAALHRPSEAGYGRAFGAALMRPSEAAIGRALAAARGGAFGARRAPGTAGQMKSPKRKLTAAEKAARKRVKKAHSAIARAARLPGKKKRSGKKRAPAAAARKATRRSSRKKVATVSAAQVIAKAATAALKTWACRGPKRTGCGAGGTRVVSVGKLPVGGLRRIRPPRFMTAG
ncbi:MAG TPA: hypothetical protein VNN80_10905 [Polyangiaceae bacterium]|nr:hypothetical protein [Polyangiaceae bacterium]HWP06540.1 hypothetical protein [Polyangiaceae bacterium]